LIYEAERILLSFQLTNLLSFTINILCVLHNIQSIFT
jgi:hypothetical protein